jgi:hypothetical protein
LTGTNEKRIDKSLGRKSRFANQRAKRFCAAKPA